MATKKTVSTAAENAEAAATDVTTVYGDAGKTDNESTKAGTADASQTTGASTGGGTVTASYEGSFSLETAPVEADKNIIGEAEAPAYTPEEFSRVAYKVFDTPYPQDIVLVALKLAGKKTYTKAEAETIVKAFANKEV